MIRKLGLAVILFFFTLTSIPYISAIFAQPEQEPTPIPIEPLGITVLPVSGMTETVRPLTGTTSLTPTDSGSGVIFVTPTETFAPTDQSAEITSTPIPDTVTATPSQTPVEVPIFQPSPTLTPTPFPMPSGDTSGSGTPGLSQPLSTCTLVGTDYAIVTSMSELAEAVSCANDELVTIPYKIYIDDGAGTFNFLGSLAITKDVEIYGRGVQNTVFDGGGTHRLFSVSAKLKLSHITLQNGFFTGYGGAIGVTISGSLEVYDSNFINNRATTSGGAIFNYGQAHIERTTFVGNQGGAAAIQNGSIAPSSTATTFVECSRFEDNTNGYAALTHGETSVSTTVTLSTFADNLQFEIVNLSNQSPPVTVNASNNWWNNRNPAGLIDGEPIDVSSPLSADPTIDTGLCPPADPEPIPGTGETCPIPPAQGFAALEAETTRCLLEMYNVIAVGDEWDDEGNEELLDELLNAVDKTAKALCQFSNGGTPCNSTTEEQEKFIEVMIGNDTDTIDVTLILSGNCDTSKEDLIIDCFPGATEHTFVHELGHIFHYRTFAASPIVNPTATPCDDGDPNTNIVGFIFCMANPKDDIDDGSLGAGNAGFIFGYRTLSYRRTTIEKIISELDPDSVNYDVEADDFTYNLCFEPNSVYAPATGLCDHGPNRPSTPPEAQPGIDWQRGEKGWDGISLDGYGACVNATIEYETSSFQQHPCIVPDWILVNLSPELRETLTVTEQEEAGSDMFLNWVYRSVDGEVSDAFSGAEPLSQPPAPYFGPQYVDKPGNVRFDWINEQLSEFFDYYGWQGA